MVHPSLDDLLLRQFAQPCRELGEIIRIRAAAAHAERSHANASQSKCFRHRAEVSQRNHFVLETTRVHSQDEAVQHFFGAIGSQTRNDVGDADHETCSNAVGTAGPGADSDTASLGANDATSIMDRDCMP